MPIDTVMGRKRSPLRDRGSWYLCKKEGEIMNTCVCYFLELELLFYFFFCMQLQWLGPTASFRTNQSGGKSLY